jgi:hypothetical protein
MSMKSSFKVTVNVVRRPDGGVRVWSEQIPELVLSGRDERKVIDDIGPALEVILAYKLGGMVRVEGLDSIVAAIAARKTVSEPTRSPRPIITTQARQLEFAASAALG